MKKITQLFMALFLMLTAFSVFAPAAPAEESAVKPDEAVMAKGRELFNAKEGLGVKYACISCHKNDKAIKKTSVKKLGDKLPSAINKYITGKAKGDKPLAVDSAEMQALKDYITYEHAK